jgi:hypothetical protein
MQGRAGGDRWFGRSIPQHVNSNSDAHALDHGRHGRGRGTDGMAAAPPLGGRAPGLPREETEAEASFRGNSEVGDVVFGQLFVFFFQSPRPVPLSATPKRAMV